MQQQIPTNANGTLRAGAICSKIIKTCGELFRRRFKPTFTPKAIMTPSDKPTPAQVEASPSKKSEFLLGRRETSTHSPTWQRMFLTNVEVQRGTSRSQERSSLRAISRNISPARRGIVRNSGTSCTAPGGCVIRGDSTTIRNHRPTTLRKWLVSQRLHLATRSKRHSLRKHLPRCG